MADKILKIDKLSVSYGGSNIISGITFSMDVGDTVCMLGESGSGKSTLLKAVSNLPELETIITAGRIIYDGRDIMDFSDKEIRQIAGSGIGMVQQYLGGAFNPLRTFEKQFREALISHGMVYSFEEIADVFNKLNLPEPKRVMKSRPFEMSGGMVQRIAIAMAMILKPKLLLCDEPTSALDVTTQKKVVKELMKMRDEQGTSILLVTHNPGIASMLGGYVGIMYGGHLVEFGKSADVLHSPAHVYTKALIGAIPDFSFKLPGGIDSSQYDDRSRNLSSIDKTYIYKEVGDEHFIAADNE